jgi:DNA modification methylase
MALPDYLITMRKPGDNLEPIAGRFDDYYGTDKFNAPTAENFSIECWQRYAEPVWWDIDASDVLNYRDARDSDDERHIAPLQLTVIRRALQLWSNRGDVVLSPFAGIGSEGYVSLDMDRKFVGFELKQSYWEIAKKNLEYIENKPKQVSLFDVA